MATMKEMTLECCDGMKLAAQMWEAKSQSRGGGGGHPAMGNPYGGMMGGGYGGMMGGGNPYGMMGGTGSSNDTSGGGSVKNIRILAVHGLRDNCRSYYYLAPNLVERLSKSANPYGGETIQVELCAVDLPGHGKSSFTSKDCASTVYLEYIFYIGESLKQLKWDEGSAKVILIGHSFGASLCLAYAAAFPERVEKLVLLDRATPKSLLIDTTVSNLRDHVSRRQLSANTSQTSRLLYETKEQAIDSRVKAAALNPGGKQTISKEASKELVERGTKHIAGGFMFSHDIRFDWPLIVEMVPEQVLLINKAVKCPTAKLFAENGWEYSEDYIKLEDESLRPTINKILPGSHHFHADPTTSKRVLDEVYDFLSK